VTGHPSHLALDRHHLARRPSGPVEAHALGCTRCSGYLEGLAARPSLPASVRVRAGEASPHRRGFRPRFLPVGAALAFSVMAFSIVAVLRGSEPGASLRTKGAPSVEVLVKRGVAEPFVWNGVSALLPGDRLQLRLHRSDFRRAEIQALLPEHPPLVLWRGELKAPEVIPEKAWELDARGGAEHVKVIFRAEPPGTQELAVDLVIPKAAAP
jgi:hypothetical protein